jgi:hypothetical protein
MFPSRCFVHRSFGNGFLFFLVDECTRWAKGDTSGLLLAIKGSDAFPITINDGNVTFLMEELQYFDSRHLAAKNPVHKRRAEGFAQSTPLAQIFNDIDPFHRPIALFGLCIRRLPLISISPWPRRGFISMPDVVLQALK